MKRKSTSPRWLCWLCTSRSRLAKLCKIIIFDYLNRQFSEEGLVSDLGKSKLHERELNLLESQKLVMKVDKEFAGIFKRSQMEFGKDFYLRKLFSSKGSITPLLKKSVLKKNNDTKKDEDLKNKELLESIPIIQDQIKDLKEGL